MKARIGLVALLLSCLFPLAQAQQKTLTKDWPRTTPRAVGLDPSALAALDADIAAGKYGLVDSMLIIRDGKRWRGLTRMTTGKFTVSVPSTKGL